MEYFENTIEKKIIEDNLKDISYFLLNRSTSGTSNINRTSQKIFNFNKENLYSLCGDNNCMLYLNTSFFEDKKISKDIGYFQHKSIVYILYHEFGIYIGQTTDFLRRMYTHIKDVSKSGDLYELWNATEHMYVSILHCLDGKCDNTIKCMEEEYLNQLIQWKQNENIKNFVFNINK